MEEKTKDAIDEERWLHSGDIGEVDKVTLNLKCTLVYDLNFYRMVSSISLIASKVTDMMCGGFV